MLAGHLGGKDAYTFVGEGGGIRLASIAVFKRDIIARLTLGILLDFEIGAGVLVSGGCHSTGYDTIGYDTIRVIISLYLFYHLRLKHRPKTFHDFVS